MKNCLKQEGLNRRLNEQQKNLYDQLIRCWISIHKFLRPQALRNYNNQLIVSETEIAIATSNRNRRSTKTLNEEKCYEYCEGLMCSCQNGYPLTGCECSSNGAEECSSCFRGYYKEANMCKINKCPCENGVAAQDGMDCPVNEVSQCVSCNKGYYKVTETIINDPRYLYGTSFETTTCEINKCRCINGTPVPDGPDCPNDSFNVCKSCDIGFHKVGPNCSSNSCVCPNGIPTSEAAGHDCLYQGETECASCHVGYHLLQETKQCVINECECLHGEPVYDGPDCPNHGDIKCSPGKCEQGYYYVEATQSCYQNECTCENGVVVSNDMCEENGRNQCQTCNDGFRFENIASNFKKCLLKQCTCANGEPSVGIDCPEDGDENCSTCNDGYVRSKYQAFHGDFNFFEAAEYCKAKGMSIARIFTEEDALLVEKVIEEKSYWLGARKIIDTTTQKEEFYWMNFDDGIIRGDLYDLQPEVQMHPIGNQEAGQVAYKHSDGNGGTVPAFKIVERSDGYVTINLKGTNLVLGFGSSVDAQHLSSAMTFAYNETDLYLDNKLWKLIRDEDSGLHYFMLKNLHQVLHLDLSSKGHLIVWYKNSQIYQQRFKLTTNLLSIDRNIRLKDTYIRWGDGQPNNWQDSHQSQNEDCLVLQFDGDRGQAFLDFDNFSIMTVAKKLGVGQK